MRQKRKKHVPLGRKTADPLEDLKQIFPDTFDGQVGLFDGEAHLKFSPEACPVQLAPRSLPQSIMSTLKKELNKMEKRYNSCLPSDNEVGPQPYVTKKNGSLRLCLDPKNLNKYLICNVHYNASLEDALNSFRN